MAKEYGPIMTKPVQAKDYPILITHEGNLHVLRIRELLLVERDENLSVGHKRLLQRATDLIIEQEAFGAADDLPRPGGIIIEEQENKSLSIFAFKCGLITLVLVIVLAAAAATFTYAVREPVRQTENNLGELTITKLEKNFCERNNKVFMLELHRCLALAMRKPFRILSSTLLRSDLNSPS